MFGLEVLGMAENNEPQKSLNCYRGFFLSIACPTIFYFLWTFGRYFAYFEDLLFGIMFFVLPVGLVFALVLSFLGVKEAEEYNLKGKGLGIAGSIISMVGIMFFILLISIVAMIADGLGNLLNETFHQWASNSRTIW